jgi:hypothetical protein
MEANENVWVVAQRASVDLGATNPMLSETRDAFALMNATLGWGSPHAIGSAKRVRGCNGADRTTLRGKVTLGGRGIPPFRAGERNALGGTNLASRLLAPRTRSPCYTAKIRATE